METYNGIAPDPRTIQEQNKDYQYKDLARGEVEVKWVEKDILKNYPIQNQDGSLSCVAQATAKLLGIHEVVEGRDYMQLCPKFIYTRRENYPSGGMWLPNALSLACKYGSCPEPFMPCDFKGETFMNDKTELAGLEKRALEYRAKYYFQLNINIDEIAQVLEQGYGVLLGFRFDYNEWDDVPHIDPNSKNECGHGVAAVDYMLYDGKKALLIEDSWGVKTGKGGRRIITEEFLMDKCFYAGFITSLPNFQFTQFLRKGSRGIEVRKLQEVLQITVDGIFGPITEKAVKVYQKSKGLVADGLVGPLTRNALNKDL
jgi:peptidoglycan hydrolase-like protein with peptidoglycan-binding domain